MQLTIIFASLLRLFPLVAVAEEGPVCTQDAAGEEVCVSPDVVDTYEDTRQCEDWAKRCECDANPKFMLVQCKRSCALHKSSCKDLDDDCKQKVRRSCGPNEWARCAKTCQKIDAKRKKEAKKCWRIPLPGGLQDTSVDQMFKRLTEEEWGKKYEPKVLSTDPWIVYLDKFIPGEMIDGVLQAMNDLGGEFAQSGELSAAAEHGEQRRTSETLFCSKRECISEPRVLKVHDVVTNVTGLQLPCHELMQIVRYKPGQYYVRHQDTSNEYGRAAHGHRIYTMFAYLSDVPEDAGGETSFPSLGLKVRPKKGAAVLWSNVLANNPRQEDRRTDHESLPVLNVTDADGKPPLKIAANLWLYGYDWRENWHKGCMNLDAKY